jgi:hypothetical protein
MLWKSEGKRPSTDMKTKKTEEVMVIVVKVEGYVVFAEDADLAMFVREAITHE